MTEPIEPNEYLGRVHYCTTRTRKTGIEETLLQLDAMNDLLYDDALFVLPGRHRLNYGEFVKVRYRGNRNKILGCSTQDASDPQNVKILRYTIYRDHTFKEEVKVYEWSGEETPF